MPIRRERKAVFHQPHLRSSVESRSPAIVESRDQKPPMKRTFIAVALLAAVTFIHAAENPQPAKKPDAHAGPEGIRDLKIGDAAPDFSLPGIDGRTHTLAEYKGAKVLMIAFLSNHCPDSHGAEGRIKQFVADMKGRGVTLVAINPNNPDGLSIDELGYSKYNDGFDDMKKIGRAHV